MADLESYPIDDGSAKPDVIPPCPPAEDIVDEPPTVIPSPSTTENKE